MLASPGGSFKGACPSCRRVPGKRELRAWAALASTLVQQGWPVGRALERAFLQVSLTPWQGLQLLCSRRFVGFDSLRPRGRGLLVLN